MLYLIRTSSFGLRPRSTLLSRRPTAAARIAALRPPCDDNEDRGGARARGTSHCRPSWGRSNTRDNHHVFQLESDEFCKLEFPNLQ